MEKKFVEIVVTIQVNEEIRLELGNVEMVGSRSRTITRTMVVENGLRVVYKHTIELIRCFDTLKFKPVENGIVGENESGSLKVEMYFREFLLEG